MLNIFSKTPVDPLCHWIVSASRFWHVWANYSHAHLIARLKKGAQQIACVRFRRCATCNAERVIFHDGAFLYWRMDWGQFRRLLIEKFKLVMFSRVAQRRPLVFDRFLCVAYKTHRAMSVKVSLHSGFLSLQVWSGCAMTAAHRKTLDSRVGAMCPCGVGIRDIRHCLYSCSLFPPPSLLERSKRMLAQSVALLFPAEPSPSE